MNQSPEEEVKKECLNRLDQWQRWGIVVDYDDVSRLGVTSHRGRWIMRTKAGKRDVVAHFKVANVLWVYLIECKEPSGGVWSDDQQEYAQKFEGLENCIYEVVTNAKQIDATLDRITNRTELLLKEIDNIMDKSYPTVKCEEELW